jgi:hypothetical protein
MRTDMLLPVTDVIEEKKYLVYVDLMSFLLSDFLLML